MRSGTLKRISGNPKLSLEAVGESGFEKSFFPIDHRLLRMCLRNLKSLGEVMPLDCLAMYALIWKRKRSTADSCSIVSLITLCVTLFVSQVSERATIHVTQVGCALNPANNCTANKKVNDYCKDRSPDLDQKCQLRWRWHQKSHHCLQTHWKRLSRNENILYSPFSKLKLFTE